MLVSFNVTKLVASATAISNRFDAYMQAQVDLISSIATPVLVISTEVVKAATAVAQQVEAPKCLTEDPVPSDECCEAIGGFHLALAGWKDAVSPTAAVADDTDDADLN